jgi:AbrB family looped-hinge helix DNA binding protein
MQTRVSSKGQVVLPITVRRKLGLGPGDPLDVNVSKGRAVLTPQRSPARRPKIVIDRVTGLPALTAGPDAPLLTSAQVQEILATFP